MLMLPGLTSVGVGGACGCVRSCPEKAVTFRARPAIKRAAGIRRALLRLILFVMDFMIASLFTMFVPSCNKRGSDFFQRARAALPHHQIQFVAENLNHSLDAGLSK